MVILNLRSMSPSAALPPPPRKPAQGPAAVHAGTYGAQLRAKVLHRCLAFAVQLVHVDTTDLAITLVQRQEPGPAPSPASHLRVRDAVHVDIRSLALHPDGEGCSAPQVLAGVCSRWSHALTVYPVEELWLVDNLGGCGSVPSRGAPLRDLGLAAKRVQPSRTAVHACQHVSLWQWDSQTEHTRARRPLSECCGLG